MNIVTGREEEKLKKVVSELGIGDYVIFTGWGDDIPEIMPALDLLVLP
jgi:glycosyltransferase involved in cell wall biosynthesis